MKQTERHVGRQPEFSRRLTLVELLFVVGVFLVGGACLFPAAFRARMKEKALQAVCYQQMKQCHAATLMYVHDFDGFLPCNHNPACGDRTTSPWSSILVSGLQYLDGETALCPSLAPAKFGGGWNSYASSVRGHVKFLNGAKGATLKGFAETPLFMDSIDQKAGKQVWCGFAYADFASVHCRHENRANVIFLDGHAEALEKSVLCGKPWKFNESFVVEQ